MTTMTEAPAEQAASAPARRPASGIAIDPDRLAAWRDMRGWSRADLAQAVCDLGWVDHRGRPVTYTRDALAKLENGERKPKAQTLRALCAALSTDEEKCTPRDLMPGGPQIAVSTRTRARKIRLDYNEGMREYADRHGISYRDDETGRVYYPKDLRDAYAQYLLSQHPRGARDGQAHSELLAS